MKGTKWTVASDAAGQRLDAWLADREDVGSRGRAREWIERGKVFLNGDEVTFDRAGNRVKAGDEVVLWTDRPGSSTRRGRDLITRRSLLRVVFEDETLLVADKPPGLLVEPLPADDSEITLKHLVEDHARKGARRGRILVVHRIDRDTSGLVLFARNERAQAALKRQFERHTAERAYLAVLSGRPRNKEGTWKDLLVWDKERLRQRRSRAGDSRAREAEASFRVIEQFEEAALVEVRLRTGKRNQIRIQAALRGHPVVGERLYVPREARPAMTFSRQALHAARLAFLHPSTGSRVEFSAPLPADLRGLIHRLRAHG